MNLTASHSKSKWALLCMLNRAINPKLMIVVLLLFSLQVSASSYAQKITIIKKQIALTDVFKAIEKQTDYLFFYDKDQVQKLNPIDISLKNATLEAALSACLKEQPLTYSIVKNTIVIRPKKIKKTVLPVTENTAEIIAAVPPPAVIKGVVVDKDGKPLPAVTVMLSGTKTGTTTDNEGHFSLNLSDAQNAVLEISSIGYATQKITVGNQQALHIVLESTDDDLGDIVVVGYGTQKKVNLTGAVTMVESEAIEKRQVQNVGQALQGVVPGLNLASNNLGGELDNTLNIDIRGMGTIGSGSKAGPLILIDGFEGDMNAINPKDIESVAVLKDAAASSIYGSRAAFGVILITTKSGQAGKIQVNYSSNVRFDALMNSPQTMGAEKYIQYINRAAAGEGSTQPISDLVIDRLKEYLAGRYQNSKDSYYPIGNSNEGEWRDLIANTDWYNTYYKSWTPSQEHNLSASGGNDKVTYRLSAGFLDQKGKLRYGSDDFKRYTVSAKIVSNLASWAKLRYASSWIRSTYDRPSYLSSSNSGWFFHNTTRASPLGPVTDPNGHYMSGTGIIQLLEGGRANNTKDVLNQQIQAVFEPVKNWHITVEGNMTTYNIDNHTAILPVYRYNAFEKALPFAWDYWHAIGQSQVQESVSKRNYYSTNVYSDYTTTFGGDHHLRFLAGFNNEYEKFKGLDASRDGLLSTEVPTIGTTTSNPQIEGDLNDWANAGYFGRINYDYKQKYLLEINGRYDGSSRFISSKRWSFFPSFSAGWNIANENFFENAKTAVSLLKLRGSYGSLGNMNTTNLYPFYAIMPVTASGGGWLINGQRPNIASNPLLVSQGLTWESVSSFNLGIDWAALSNRLTGSFDYYKRYTNDMVGPAPELPSTLGTEVPSINNTDMQSYGFELSLSWRDKIGEVGYGVKANLANDKQKVTNYPNEIMNFSTWYSGKISGEIWGFETVGIAQSQDQMDAHLAKLPNGGQGYFGSDWSAGDIMYKDLNGDGKVDQGAGTVKDPGDMKIIGNNTPQYKIGIDIDASWRNFDFSMFWSGVLKRDFNIPNAEANSLFWGANANSAETFALVEHWDFWRPEGDPLGANTNGYYPRPLFAQGYKNKYPQTRYLLNAAYLRLKNIQVGYTLPKRLSDKIGAGSLRFYVSAENLITITPLTKLLDPEVIGGRWGPGQTYPLGKTYAAGINVNF